MKDSKFRYYLCYYSHLCFFYSFWGYFFYINYFASSWHGNECVFGLLILFCYLDYGEEVLLHYLQLVI